MMYWYEDEEVDDEPLLMDTWLGAGLVLAFGYVVIGCGAIKRLFNRCTKLVGRGK